MADGKSNDPGEASARAIGAPGIDELALVSVCIGAVSREPVS
jgi:hypothetical protein